MYYTAMPRMISLFSGSGGFELAGTLCGIEPIAASEVEPYPIAVTRSRFPQMKHLGDVTKINGAEVEPVDIITIGSPCQDLSVAGKRAGLKHKDNGDDETTRSGLFMEAVRIIKEMREATNGIYPRFALWENVPGAFSSNKGEGFRIVLEELIKVVEPSAVMPAVPKAGWAYADSYVGDGWSIAYRVFDAQYWGVPQRRRRIYLVADFRGECAGKILFEREGLRGYPAEGGTPRQGTAADAEGSLGADDRTGAVCYGISSYDSNAMKSSNPHNGGEPVVAYGIDHVITTGGNCTAQGSCVYEDIQATLKAGGVHAVAFAQNQRDEVRDLKGVAGALAAEPGMKQQTFVAVPNLLLDDQGGQQVNVRTDGKSPTLRAEMHGNIPAVMEPVVFKADDGSTSEATPTLVGDHNNRITDHTALVVFATYNQNTIDRPAVCYAETYQRTTGPLMANSHPGSYSGQDAYTDMFVVGKETEQEPQTVVYALDRASFNQGQNAQYDFEITDSGVNSTLVAKEPSAVAYASRVASFYPQMKAESQCYREDGVANTVVNGTNPGYQNGVVQSVAHGVDCRNATEYKELTGALQADATHNINSNNTVRVRHIVRRLTPTECARLQGFPDEWGHIDPKEDLTDEEYRFWCKVNLEYSEMQGTARSDGKGWYEVWREVKPNKKKGEDFEPYWENIGKPYKHKTKKQMLVWYNKLWTDSAEYKMWGNGIALPCALYVMRGIAKICRGVS